MGLVREVVAYVFIFDLKKKYSFFFAALLCKLEQFFIMVWSQYNFSNSYSSVFEDFSFLNSSKFHWRFLQRCGNFSFG
jgi:hypothetical protein